MVTTKESEFEQTMSKLESLKYDPSKYYEPSTAFAFGCKLGDGSNASHFIANFTSLGLLDIINPKT
jgi:hypothetical protein